jgi:PII-like signaling protein
MRTDVPHGQMLRIYLGENDTWHGRSLYQQIVERARKQRLAGVTVLHGICGFGASSKVHSARTGRVRQDIPVVIEIADSEDRLRAFLPVLDEMLSGGLVTLEGAGLISYR